jgi:hypothetical protein
VERAKRLLPVPRKNFAIRSLDFMELNLNCLRCKENMELGFLLDYSEGIHYPGKWVKGQAEKSTWVEGSVKVPKVSIEIVTYRCVACGYLESYAK